MADLPLEFQPHTITVQTRTGETGAGPTYAAAREARCMIDAKVRLVRNQLGDQVVSSTTLLTTADPAWFTPGSTTDRGTVIIASTRDDGGMGGWCHLEVALA